jgi:hypothetical protein
MTQALYAHMNFKKSKKEIIRIISLIIAQKKNNILSNEFNQGSKRLV